MVNKGKTSLISISSIPFSLQNCALFWRSSFFKIIYDLYLDGNTENSPLHTISVRKAVIYCYLTTKIFFRITSVKKYLIIICLNNELVFPLPFFFSSFCLYLFFSTTFVFWRFKFFYKSRSNLFAEKSYVILKKRSSSRPNCFFDCFLFCLNENPMNG